MKAALLSLGCKVNKYEIDCMASILLGAGYEVTTRLEPADVFVVNTCAVTSEAEKKSRQYIAKITKLSPKAKIIVCGCASQNNINQFADKPNVVSVIGNAGKEQVLNLIAKSTHQIFDISNEYQELQNPLKTKTRAYIKVQDGCNNFCSYCIIPFLRGRSRSRSLKDIKREALALSKTSQEIVITGIDVSSFKADQDSINKYKQTHKTYDDNLSLAVLLDTLKDVPARIRLSSLEVHAVTKNLLTMAKSMPNFAPHFHLSLQSGSTKVLKEMNRKYTAKQYLQKIKLIRKYFKNANITTDVIVGFPTETDKDFADSLKLIKKAKFGDIHAFTYSHRTGTRASKLPDLNGEIKNRRMKQLEELKHQLKHRYIHKNLHKIFTVLAEDIEDGYMIGFTQNYIKCYIQDSLVSGQMYDVKLVSPYKDGVIAQLVK